MQRSLRQGIDIEGRLQLLLAGLLGVILGFSFAYVPAVYVAVAVAVIFLVVLAIRSPQFAVLGILVLLSSVIAEEKLPRIGAGSFKIWITDLLIIGLMALIVIRLLADRTYKLFRSPVALPLVLFLLWVLLSSLRGYFFLGNSRNDVVIETRISLYYLTTFCVLYLIRSKPKIQFLLDSFYFLASIAALAMLAQYALGAQVPFLSSGKIYQFSEGGAPTVTRVQGTVGEGLVTTAFILKTVTMFIDRLRFRKVIDLAQWLVIGAGLLTTFNRTHWLMVLIALLITVALVRREERRRIILWGVVVIFLLISVSAFIVLLRPDGEAAQFIYAAAGRFVSVAAGDLYTNERTSSLLWRNFEYEYGIPQIYKHPLMGLGMGAQYRPVLAVDHKTFEGWTYSHNSNLWIAMKTGLVGFALYLWFFIAFIWHALMKWRAIPLVSHRGFVLGSALGCLVILIGANIHPFGMQLEWVPVISVIIGLSEAIIYSYRARKEGNVV
ncbi:MAG: O-antigen ligase family protein [Anaerolineae bacterium]|nr:O-antigen ligase family protein [Anaerolineae bacterium]